MQRDIQITHDLNMPDADLIIEQGIKEARAKYWTSQYNNDRTLIGGGEIMVNDTHRQAEDVAPFERVSNTLTEMGGEMIHENDKCIIFKI